MTPAFTAHPRNRNRHLQRKNAMLAHPLKIVAGLFAAGLLACAPAQAAYGTAAASLNNIQFQLIDLDLTDNINPSITFSSTNASGYLSFFASGVGGTNYLNGFDTVSQVFTNGSVSATNGATSMHSETHANAVAGQLSSNVSTAQAFYFTLSPSTRLSFSAQADAFVQEEGISQAMAFASIGGSFETAVNGVSGKEEFSRSLSSSDGMRNRYLQGWFDAGTAGGTGKLYANTSSSFSHYPNMAPVPEPETYGMLMAGLLVVGSIARRKAGNKASKA